jgi:hypothetical protein
VPLVSAPRRYVLVRAGEAGGVSVGVGAAAAGSAHMGPPRAGVANRPPEPYDPWAAPEPGDAETVEVAAAGLEPTRTRGGAPLLPALLAVVGALGGYWAGTHGFLGALPLVSATGPAGLAVLGASLGLLAGWAGDRWTASQ